MNATAYQPSTRNRIYNLVLANAKRTGRPPVKVWDDLYREFEHRSNTPWKRLAHNNESTVLDVIHSLRKLDGLLECARDHLAPPTGSNEGGDAG